MVCSYKSTINVQICIKCHKELIKDVNYENKSIHYGLLNVPYRPTSFYFISPPLF